MRAQPDIILTLGATQWGPVAGLDLPGFLMASASVYQAGVGAFLFTGKEVNISCQKHVPLAARSLQALFG
ncbi:MAG: hypothetical protein KAT27_08125 [Desulfobacterales bacterium]|nr:hypothetical protein [Desulfobacterales bacterium]